MKNPNSSIPAVLWQMNEILWLSLFSGGTLVRLANLRIDQAYSRQVLLILGTSVFSAYSLGRLTSVPSSKDRLLTLADGQWPVCPHTQPYLINSPSSIVRRMSWAFICYSFVISLLAHGLGIKKVQDLNGQLTFHEMLSYFS